MDTETRERITSLARLCELAEQRRAIVIPKWSNFIRQPAAFIVNMQARMVQNMFDVGMYLYEKEEKK